MRHVVLLVALLLCVSTCSAWKNMVTPLVCLDDYCDLIFPAQDYSPFVGYSFYVRVRLFLNVSSSPEDKDQDQEGVALTLTGAELSKEHGAAPGPGALPIGAFAIFLLKSATTFAASVTYGKGAVVGRARADCPHTTNRTLSCLESVEIRQDLFESDTSKFTAYDARYWRRLVARHVRDFGARDLRVALQLQRDDRLDAHYYVNPLLQGAPLSELALRDVADIGAVDLGPQEALVKLTVTGVQVNNYTGLLSGAPHLRSLTLSHVDLTTLEPLSGLEQLETLDVSGNPSLDLAVSAPQLPASLTSLSVSDCPRAVTSLPPLLRRLPRLRRLDAAGCSLRTLETFPFPSLPLLEHLDLSRNQLTAVPDDAFSSLAALRTLNLSGNSLTSVSLQLDSAATLTLLDLADNLLESPAHLLRAGKVATLNLSGNPVVEWADADAFFPWLAGGGVLDLSRCRVAFLTAPMRASLSRAAQSRAVVLLDANPLDCEHCRVAELKEWLTAPEGAALAPSLRCAKPPALEGQLVATAPGEGVCPKEGGPDLYAVLLPLGAVMLALGAAAGGAGYVYRYEITYIKHLVKLRRGRMRGNSGGGGGVFRYDAFVCYSGNDRNWVMRKLLPELENGPGRYRLCLHERDFILGSIIARNIVSFMQESRNTIVVLTESFVKSQWCQWELDMANHKVFADDRDFLIFVELERLERRTLPRHLRYLMDTRTYLEWPASGDVDVPDEEALWRRLRTAMGPSIATSAGASPVASNAVATTVDTVTTTASSA